MSTKPAFVLLALSLTALLLAACSPFAISEASGGPAQPTVEVIGRPVAQALVVDHVIVEIGVGSPIPVYAVISATFPDMCAQLVEMQQFTEGSTFNFTLMTSAPTEGCESAAGPVPFRLELPINAVALEPGTYTVTVNGVSDTFDYLQ